MKIIASCIYDNRLSLLSVALTSVHDSEDVYVWVL
jgi:hypothetical protein